MRQIITVFFVAITMIACKQEKKENDTQTTEPAQVEKEVAAYESFGAKIDDKSSMTMTAMAAKFDEMKPGDTIDVKFTSTINSVCKKKGCWMRLDLGDDKETMVRFKDYGFFVPLDSDGAEVIVNGKAFVAETSVEDLKHYAKDAGKSEEEIAAITEPSVTYSFLADGVLMKQ